MQENMRAPQLREALLVKLAKLLNLTPASFLKIDHDLRKSSTISIITTMSLFSPITKTSQDKIHQICLTAIDAGVITKEDIPGIFNSI